MASGRTLRLCGCCSLVLLLLLGEISAQSIGDRYRDIGRLVLLRLPTAPFPHPERADGHTYSNEQYPADRHYRDSSVAVFIPAGFSPAQPFDLVVHVHGWRNNVDSVLAQFDLPEQLAASGRNAILVVPQGPKNAPDSFGGKLEEAGAFAVFIDDVLGELRARDILNNAGEPGIILSGHSGAYRMISYILLRGGLTDQVREVYLFDALYGQLEKYAYWLDNYDGRCVVIYTDGGGTRSTTEGLMEDLDAWGIPYGMREEERLKESDLREHRILFIHTELSHNDVLHGRRQFETYLRTGAKRPDAE